VDFSLPAIPAKRYFTIGEVSELCGVKPHVLRYWEQEFAQLKPMKRRGNRRYYQHHEVLLIRRIRELLYEQGFTISGARNRLAESSAHGRGTHAASTSHALAPDDAVSRSAGDAADTCSESEAAARLAPGAATAQGDSDADVDWTQVRRELLAIRDLLVQA